MNYKVYNTGFHSIMEAAYLGGKTVNAIQHSNMLINPELKYVYKKNIIVNNPEIKLDYKLGIMNNVTYRFPYNDFKVEPYDTSEKKFDYVCRYNRFLMVMNPTMLDTDFFELKGNLIEAKGFCLLKTDLKTNGQLNLLGYIDHIANES